MLFASGKREIHSYEVSYLGIPLLDMTLTWVEDDSTVKISYDNQLKPFIAYFHPVHNVYQVHFKKESFAPISWSKSVSEGDMRFRLHANRSNDGKTARYSNGYKLDFPENGLTVFSATHYLAANAHHTEFFPKIIPVFIDGEVWEATATRYDAGHPHPEHTLSGDEILIQTNLHYVSGTSLIETNDILTSVIATEGTQFLLWVRPDGTYTKAQFGKFPKAVILRKVKN